MLAVATVEDYSPMVFVILLEAGDYALHLWSAATCRRLVCLKRPFAFLIHTWLKPGVNETNSGGTLDPIFEAKATTLCHAFTARTLTLRLSLPGAVHIVRRIQDTQV